MAVRSFYTPPVAPPGNGQRAFFEQPAPGKARVIRNVIVQDVGVLGPTDVLTVEKLPDGILFAMGAGTNNAMTAGAHQLFNPVEQRSGENVWVQPPAIASIVTPQGEGAAAAGALNPATAIAAPELVLIAAGTLDGGSLASQGFTDTQSNTYKNLEAVTLGSTGGLTVAATNLDSTLEPTDTINWTASGWNGAPAMAAISATGAARTAAQNAYATAAASATSGAASVVSAGAIARGDLAVLVAINASIDPAPGGAWQQLEIARGTTSRLAVFVQTGAGATVSGSWATGNAAWIGVITALPAAAGFGYGSLAVALSGQEADLRMGI